jgi:uncharacterized membrane protein
MARHNSASLWWRRMVRFWLPLRVVRGHTRIFVGIAAGLLSEILLPGQFRAWTRFLIDWNVGVWLYFVTVGVMIAGASPQSMRRRAKISDEGSFFILVFTSLAALASIVAIVAQLAAVRPDYYDFLYFSYVIGVACQTADVDISSAEMRRTALVHGVLAFFFNSAVLALTINIAAGLI